MKNVCVIGLGYVGLPLFLQLYSRMQSDHVNSVVGFDKNSQRVLELSSGYDRNADTDPAVLNGLAGLNMFTDCESRLSSAQVYVVCVPTPITVDRKTDFSFVESAISLVAKYLSRGDLVILESTVSPGTTHEMVVRKLELQTGMSLSTGDFYVGYSPERINPGAGFYQLQSMTKVVSGVSDASAEACRYFYKEVMGVTTYKCVGVIEAELAKLIENVQRDVNIALMNSLSMICRQLNVSVYDVLDAARTKWNFLDFTPGLVGGHCVSVDPYYLIEAGRRLGVDMSLLVDARQTNDQMVNHVVDLTLSRLDDFGVQCESARVIILGVTFKENVNDLRESLALKIVESLKDKVSGIDIFDPLLTDDIQGLVSEDFILMNNIYDIALLLTPHDYFKSTFVEVFLDKQDLKCGLFDLKGVCRNRDNVWSM